jgi:hypothetical protein
MADSLQTGNGNAARKHTLATRLNYKDQQDEDSIRYEAAWGRSHLDNGSLQISLELPGDGKQQSSLNDPYTVHCRKVKGAWQSSLGDGKLSFVEDLLCSSPCSPVSEERRGLASEREQDSLNNYQWLNLSTANYPAADAMMRKKFEDEESEHRLSEFLEVYKYSSDRMTGSFPATTKKDGRRHDDARMLSVWAYVCMYIRACVCTCIHICICSLKVVIQL